MFGKRSGRVDAVVSSRLQVLLNDVEARNEEIRLRIGHEHTSYITYFSSLIAVVVALVAADKLGILLAAPLQSVLPVLALALAVFLLWLPLDAINEQLRIRLAAVYIEREIRPQIMRIVDSDELLHWESFQGSLMLKLRAPTLFLSAMLVFRAFIAYSPSLVAVGAFVLGGEAFRSPDLLWLEIGLLALWGLAALIPLIGAIYLGTSKNLSLD